jgi:hypothetical protein
MEQEPDNQWARLVDLVIAEVVRRHGDPSLFEHDASTRALAGRVRAYGGASEYRYVRAVHDLADLRARALEFVDGWQQQLGAPFPRS